MLQMRDKSGRAYNPGRDLAQLFPRMAEEACRQLSMAGWHPKVRAWAEHAGLTQKDLEAAEVALAKYCLLSTTDKAIRKTDAWVNSGLSALHPAAMLMIFFFVGTVTADTYLKAVREATRISAAPWGADQMAQLVARYTDAGRAGSSRTKQRRMADARKVAEKTQSPDMFD